MMAPELCVDLGLIKNKDLLRKVNLSIAVIEKAIAEYKVEGSALSFNGGKDCCVLLHLLYITSFRHPDLFTRLNVLYFSHPNCFPEVNSFVTKCQKIYGLKLTILPPLTIPTLQQQVNKLNMKAIFMGTRSTDPRSSTLKDFTPTDPGWPQVMRVNPILQWEYEDVWNFILDMKIPYCELYDRGYTSIGAETDTTPNPSLKNSGTGTYEPAYKLLDGTQERAGRLSG